VGVFVGYTTGARAPSYLKDSNPPAFPIFTYRMEFIAVTGGYQLNTFSNETGYIDGQYSLALSIAFAMNESFTVSDSQVNVFQIPLALSSTINLTDAITSVLVIPVSLSSTLDMSDAADVQMTINVSLPESLELADALRLSGFGLKGYVMNTATGAVSTYDGWNFNSMAKVGQSYYAAGQAGLVRIGADDDVGTGIEASVTTGITDFDSTRMKRIRKAYMGVSSSGQVLLKVITEGDVENIYQLEAETADYVKESPVVIGQGLRARYWQFQILNEGGSDMTLESVEFYPVILQRHY